MSKIKGWRRGWNIIHLNNWNLITKIMVWYKSKNTSYQYPKQTKNIYTYIVFYIRRRKKKTSKAKSWKNVVYILSLYVYNFNFICRKSEKKEKKKKKAKWLLGFFSNCDVFNYGSKISFLKISIDN